MINFKKGVSTPVAFIIIIILAVTLVGGVLGYQYWWGQEEEIKFPEEGEASPEVEQPESSSLPTGPFLSCGIMYKEIEEVFEDANYCERDNDCKTMEIGHIFDEPDCGWDCRKFANVETPISGEFDCYRFVNKKADEEELYQKIREYYKECELVGDNWALSPGSVCVDGRCVVKSEIVENGEETADWKTYRNEEYGFEIKYPKDAQLSEAEDETSVIYLPFTPGTPLYKKELRIEKARNISRNECFYPSYLVVEKTGKVRIKNWEFQEITGFFAISGGVVPEFENYCIMQEDKCICLSFVFRHKPIYDCPPGDDCAPIEFEKEFDPEKESEVFEQILSTFKFIE